MPYQLPGSTPTMQNTNVHFQAHIPSSSHEEIPVCWLLLSCSRRLAGPPELEGRSARSFLPISETRSLSLESCLSTGPGCWDPNGEAMRRKFFFLPSNSQGLTCSHRHQPNQTVPLCSELLGGSEAEAKSYSAEFIAGLARSS